MMGGELYLFPNVSDSLLVRSDLVNDESGSGSEPESDDDGCKTLATPSRPSTCLRAFSSFGMSQMASTILTSSWFQDDDWREDSDCQSIPDGIVAPQLDVGLCSTGFQFSDDEYENDSNASDNESADEKSSEILEAFSSGLLNFGLSLEVAHDDSDDDDMELTNGMSLCAPRLSTAAQISDDSKSDRSIVSMAKEKLEKNVPKSGVLFKDWSVADSSSTEMEAQSLFSFDNNTLLTTDTAPVEDLYQLALVPAAVESKRRGITRPLCHCRRRVALKSKEETVMRALETMTPQSAAASAFRDINDGLLKRHWNADGSRRFDFSVFVEMSQESADHITSLLQKAHLISETSQ